MTSHKTVASGGRSSSSTDRRSPASTFRISSIFGHSECSVSPLPAPGVRSLRSTHNNMQFCFHRAERPSPSHLFLHITLSSFPLSASNPSERYNLPPSIASLCSHPFVERYRASVRPCVAYHPSLARTTASELHSRDLSASFWGLGTPLSTLR